MIPHSAILNKAKDRKYVVDPDLAPTEDGLYTLALYDVDLDETGSYRVVLQCLSGTCADPVVEPARDNCIEVPNGDEMPDVLMYTTEGFINAMARFGGASPEEGRPAWTVERAEGIVRFRMTHGV